VQCDAGTKVAQVGGSPAKSIAQLLLSELVRERARAEGEEMNCERSER
jgi:hypothetical protein